LIGRNFEKILQIAMETIDEIQENWNDPDLIFIPSKDYQPWTKTERVSQFKIDDLEKRASYFWNIFYKTNGDKFFKDRHWIIREFPEILNITESPVLMECGCGVGNTVFPLIEQIPNLFVHCFDFSAEAVRLIKSNEKYNTDRVNAFVCDLATSDLSNIKDDSLDYITMIFVLSAMLPEKMDFAIQQMKPVGITDQLIN
jgi:methyltransferase-like protein 6